MAEDDKDGMDELRLPFVFVPHGAPDPVEFMRTCAEPLRIPATFRPDPQPFRPHPDAYLPTGTRTADFPHGTPACLGLIAPGYRPHSRFPHGGAPPQTDPKYRTDPVAEYHRFNQVADEAARNYGSHGIPTASSLAQAGQSTAQLIQAVDEMDAQIRAAIRSLPQNASTIPVRLAAQDPPETDEDTGPQGRPLSTQDEINRAEYNAAVDALKKLDANNPALTTITGPDYVPNDAAVARIQEVLARVQRQGPDTAADEKADKRPSTQLMLPGEPLMDQLRHPPKFELEPRPQDVEKPAATSVPPIVSPREEPNSPALRSTVSRENREHILVGKSKKGGHRFGQNRAGKPSSRRTGLMIGSSTRSRAWRTIRSPPDTLVMMAAPSSGAVAMASIS